MTPEIKKFVDAVAADKKLSPRAMGVLVDEYKRVTAERLAADKVAAALKVEEVAVKVAIVAAMRKADVKAIGGQTYSAALTQEDKPTVKDWTLFYKYIKDNDAFDLLERRISSAAAELRWEDGKALPGVDKFPVDKLSFTKLKG